MQFVQPEIPLAFLIYSGVQIKPALSFVHQLSYPLSLYIFGLAPSFQVNFLTPNATHKGEKTKYAVNAPKATHFLATSKNMHVHSANEILQLQFLKTVNALLGILSFDFSPIAINFL